MVKKIILWSVTGLVGLLAIATGIISLIKSDFKQVALDTYASIQVYDKTSSSFLDYNPNSDEYKQIVNLYNESFDESVLISLFSGAYGFEGGVVQGHVDLSARMDTSGKQYIMFFSIDEKVLTVDSKLYKNNADSIVKYNRMVLEINNTSALSEASLYIIDESESTQDELVSYYKVSMLAHFKDLHNYIINL